MDWKFILFSVVRSGLILSAVFSNSLAQDVLFLTNNSSIHISTGAELHVAGGLNASLGSSINNYGEIRLTDNSAAGVSDWTDYTAAGVLGSSTGKVFFNGTHNVTGGRFYDLVVSTAKATDLVDDLVVNNNLELDQGIIETGLYKVDITTSQSGSLISGPSNADFSIGFVRGNLRRAITSNTSTYSFPVANTSATDSNPLNLVNNNLTGVSSLLVSFNDKQGSDAGLVATEFGVSYSTVNSFGTWKIIGDAIPSSGAFDLQASLKNFTGLADNSFALLMRPNGSTDAADWVVPTGSTLPPIDQIGRTVAGKLSIRQGITLLGEFGIGSALTPLPTELLYFRGEHRTGSNLLSWSASNEVNVQYYSLQKAWDDGTSFDEIARFAAENENKADPITFQFTDKEILPGISYYKLKIIDFDGTTTYSKVVALSQSDFADLQVFPNPTRDRVKIVFRLSNASYYSISIINEHGQLINEDHAFGKEQHQSIEFDLSSFSAGIYVIRVCDSNGWCATKKIVRF